MATVDASYLRTLLEPARRVSLLVGTNPQFDAVASALGLKIALEASGKTVRIVCPDEMLVEFNRLVGVESVTHAFGSRNMVISFPEQTDYVDKVSYNLENGELQLVISPKADSPDLDPKKLKFVSGTGQPDLLILIGVDRLSDLGQINDEAGDRFQSTTLVSISRSPIAEDYTLHQLYDERASSLSELVTRLTEELELPVDADAASNLLVGIEKATGNFQSSAVSETTFEAAAILMRRGAKRHQEISAADFPVGSIPEAPVAPPPPPPAPPKKSSATTGYGTDSAPPDTETAPKPSAKSSEKKQPPADWYEPKIYSGPMLQ